MVSVITFRFGGDAFAEVLTDEPYLSRSDSKLWSLYKQHCSGCHLDDGSSVPSKGVPDLRRSGRLAGTPLGRQYLVQVPGVAQSQLDNETMAELLNWSLSHFSSHCLPEKFTPFVAEEFRTWRNSPTSDSLKMKSEVEEDAGLTPCKGYAGG
jgi:hypothetical protein